METIGHTTLRASKDLKKLSLEELPENSIALKAYKASKGSMSKAFKVEESCGNTSNKDLMRLNSLSFQGRPNLCGSTREE
ncbi:hypothetical protein CR513_00285, partial [Mucuna pruriens]